MFIIRCEKCKNEIEITKETLCDIVDGKENIDIVAFDNDIILTCFKCYNSISTKDK